jgi:hypothetical protein
LVEAAEAVVGTREIGAFETDGGLVFVDGVVVFLFVIVEQSEGVVGFGVIGFEVNGAAEEALGFVPRGAGLDGEGAFAEAEGVVVIGGGIGGVELGEVGEAFGDLIGVAGADVVHFAEEAEGAGVIGGEVDGLAEGFDGVVVVAGGVIGGAEADAEADGFGITADAVSEDFQGGFEAAVGEKIAA